MENADNSPQRQPREPKEDNFDPASFEAIVKSINFDAEEDDIREFFAKFGEVTSVKLERRYYDGRSKGSAFVKFATLEALEAAVEATGSELMGRPIRIEKTRSREERLKEFGERPRRGGRGRGRGGRGRGYRGRSRSRSYSGDRYNDERPRRTRGRGRGGNGGRGGRRPREVVTESNVIFVGNLNYRSTLDDIWDHFEQSGEVTDVRLAKYPDGRVSFFVLESRRRDSRTLSSRPTPPLVMRLDSPERSLMAGN